VARKEKMNRLSAVLTTDNQTMLHIFEKVGFRIEPVDNDKLVAAVIEP
jgi:hypothetical protein